MNRKILGIAVAVLAVAMLASPVMALCPINADNSNNPNLTLTSYGSVMIRNPGGIINEWIQEAAENEYSHVMMKGPTEFNIGNAYVPSTASQIVNHKWNYLSEDVFMEFLISVGFSAQQAYYISHVVRVGGVYYKESFMGISK